MDSRFVRDVMLTAEPPPLRQRGFPVWIRHNLFASTTDSLVTLVCILALAYVVPTLLNWLFIQAAWTGSDRSFCATAVQGGIQPDDWSGACWAFVRAKFSQFIFGRYPIDQRWRPMLVGILLILLVLPFLTPYAPRKNLNALLLFIALPVVSFFLLYGGFGLPVVETERWGGLMVTLILSFVGITVSLPLGILLALGRRSRLPVIRLFSTTFIEVLRGVPLITVLFMASVMLPLFLPDGMDIDKLLRAIVGVSIFASAYMAEVIRGGLQAIPKGQSEGADSLGLTYWKKMYLIILPQAIKLVVPGIVNTFIGMFKDSSLISIIGMFDLLGIVRFNFSDPSWATPVTPVSGLLFAGFVFWIFCFGMSRYSGFLERHLDTGHRR
ncbi:MAG: amino acid ABC transporter permease [Rhizobiales bacterium]|nr:amino acid ABC transporter permease [Hyphomicrobiales bacterium]